MRLQQPNFLGELSPVAGLSPTKIARRTLPSLNTLVTLYCQCCYRERLLFYGKRLYNALKPRATPFALGTFNRNEVKHMLPGEIVAVINSVKPFSFESFIGWCRNNDVLLYDLQKMPFAPEVKEYIETRAWQNSAC